MRARLPRKFLLPLAALVILLAAGPSEAKVPNAAYVSKAKLVASSYWQARKPAANCTDRPVEVEIVSRRPFGGLEANFPVGACQYPYDPASGCTLYPPSPIDDGPICDQTTATINVSRHVRRWVEFCTLVIQGWGSLSGELSSRKLPPTNVMYPEVTKRNLQRQACGGRPA